jgi:hypothetical protein
LQDSLAPFDCFVCSCGSFTCSHLLLVAFFILRLFLATSPPHFAPYRSCS